jgi:hypothetical protein
MIPFRKLSRETEREVTEWLESDGSRYCRCEHSNKPSCSNKGGELLYQLTDCHFVPRDYVIYGYKLSLLPSLVSILLMLFVHEGQQSHRITSILWRENVTVPS